MRQAQLASDGSQAGAGIGLETLRGRLGDPRDLVMERRGDRFKVWFGYVDARDTVRA